MFMISVLKSMDIGDFSDFQAMACASIVGTLDSWSEGTQVGGKLRDCYKNEHARATSSLDRLWARELDRSRRSDSASQVTAQPQLLSTKHAYEVKTLQNAQKHFSQYTKL